MQILSLNQEYQHPVYQKSIPNGSLKSSVPKSQANDQRGNQQRIKSRSKKLYN